jgi:C_GCAxxG_C_C family probable redox protein
MKPHQPSEASKFARMMVFMSAKTELAKQYHACGYGCGQAVLASFAQDYGLSEEVALRISTGFGSGMGRMNEVCGALTGALMVIGLKHGKMVTDGTRYGTGKETTYGLLAELAKKFQEKNGSMFCQDLVCYDFSNPNERAKVFEMGLFETKYGKAILDVVELLEEIL